MKVARSDITPIIAHTCKDLASLKQKIEENPLDVNAYEPIIHALHTDANELTRKINESSQIVPTDITGLTKSIETIRHMSTFTQSLGAYQEELLKVFDRFKNCIRKFESKVTKIENDPLRK